MDQSNGLPPQALGIETVATPSIDDELNAIMDQMGPPENDNALAPPVSVVPANDNGGEKAIDLARKAHEQVQQRREARELEEARRQLQEHQQKLRSYESIGGDIKGGNRARIVEVAQSLGMTFDEFMTHATHYAVEDNVPPNPLDEVQKLKATYEAKFRELEQRDQQVALQQALNSWVVDTQKSIVGNQTAHAALLAECEGDAQVAAELVVDQAAMYFQQTGKRLTPAEASALVNEALAKKQENRQRVLSTLRVPASSTAAHYVLQGPTSLNGQQQASNGARPHTLTATMASTSPRPPKTGQTDEESKRLVAAQLDALFGRGD